MMHDDIDHVLFSEELLAETVKKLGMEISEEYFRVASVRINEENQPTLFDATL